MLKHTVNENRYSYFQMKQFYYFPFFASFTKGSLLPVKGHSFLKSGPQSKSYVLQRWRHKFMLFFFAKLMKKCGEQRVSRT